MVFSKNSPAGFNVNRKQKFGMDRNRSVCLVGYALNPKKMRKSQTSAANTSSSASERWQGGGLADILNENSDRHNGTSIDGVTFLAWDWTLPMHLQVYRGLV